MHALCGDVLQSKNLFDWILIVRFILRLHPLSLFETTQTLFWAAFGLIDLDSFELDGIKIFTRFWGMLMFGCYSVINIVVLLNLLIAMMNHSYQLISVSGKGNKSLKVKIYYFIFNFKNNFKFFLNAQSLHKNFFRWQSRKRSINIIPMILVCEFELAITSHKSAIQDTNDDDNVILCTKRATKM